VRAGVISDAVTGFSTEATSFKSDTRLFGDIFELLYRSAAYQSTLPTVLKRRKGEGNA
jgi:hypothetical protein